MKRSRWVLLLCLLFVLGAGHGAWALPSPGAAMPSLALVDAWDRTLDGAALRGRPVVFFYEDKEAGTQNADLKRQLGELLGTPAFAQVAMIPIADVSAYDFFPARGFARDAIRAESSKIGRPIYCDWSGAVGKALGARPKTSHVIVTDAKGKITFARAGALDPEARAAFRAALASR